MFDTFFILFILINTMLPRHSLWQLGYHAHQYEKKPTVEVKSAIFGLLSYYIFYPKMLCQNKKGQTFVGILVFESFFFQQSPVQNLKKKRFKKRASQQIFDPSCFEGSLVMYR